MNFLSKVLTVIDIFVLKITFKFRLTALQYSVWWRFLCGLVSSFLGVS